MVTNRSKAIIFTNIFALTLFIYTAMLKITINVKGVNPLDICLIQVLTILVGTFITAICMGTTFKIEPQDRVLLITRSLVATIGFTTITFGVAMVPLVVQNTIFNTAPFWSSLLGWIFLSEAITPFEIVAMILSFGAIILITMSSALKNDETADIIDEPSTEPEAEMS